MLYCTKEIQSLRNRVRPDGGVFVLSGARAPVNPDRHYPALALYIPTNYSPRCCQGLLHCHRSSTWFTACHYQVLHPQDPSSPYHLDICTRKSCHPAFDLPVLAVLAAQHQHNPRPRVPTLARTV